MTLQNSFATAFVVMSFLGAAPLTRAACDETQPNPTPTSRYAITGGEVHDKKTDLTWQRCSVGQLWNDAAGCVGAIKQLTWDDAMRQASDAWRVPTREELTTLVSPICKNPAINKDVFPDMERGKAFYWTSTADGGYPWLVDFERGYTHFTFNYNLTNTSAVRLVRNGK